MSIRSADAARFSLREAVQAEAAAHPLYLTAADAPSRPALPV